MGWEKRRGRHYYYRKRREGGRVISEYVGTGPAAELAAASDGLLQQQRAKERKARAESENVEMILDDIQALTQALARATLLVEGYHTHRGQWRKKRHGKANNRRRNHPQTSDAR